MYIKIKLSVEAVLNCNAAKLMKDYTEILKREDGTFLEPTEVWNEALEAKKNGYKVFPVCENCRPDGHCSGHEEKEG